MSKPHNIMQNIVITGGSNGFGRALAREFHDRNANVLITGRNIKRLKQVKKNIERTDAKCYVYQCDVRDRRQMEKLGTYARNIFDDKIDHWINNAAICEGPVKFEELDMEDVNDIVSTNILGTIYGFKVAHDSNARNIYGVSGHGSNGAKTTDFAIYGSSKAAISQLVLSLADEMKDANVRVLAPGLMKTDLSKKLLNSDKLSWVQKVVFKMLCRDPSQVAKTIVPKILSAKGTGIIIR